MMKTRLRLAKRLLKSDGVLICTIDEHEANHLGMLLEKVFPKHLHYMITIVINPKGREKANFAPVEEFAFFVVPDVGDDGSPGIALDFRECWLAVTVLFAGLQVPATIELASDDLDLRRYRA
jgi:hypothetical protein